jgi:hypothetical protein
VARRGGGGEGGDVQEGVVVGGRGCPSCNKLDRASRFVMLS